MRSARTSRRSSATRSRSAVDEDPHAMISTSSFLDAMRAKWSDFGNVGSPALDQVWIQIAETMNKQTASPSLPRPVIPAELGAGKTTCAKLWCSMLSTDETHPGVLIVVRTIAQADEYANDINAWSGSGAPAFAYHSEVKPRPSPAVILHYPVLVICHRGYELALDELLVEEPERYERLVKFRSGQRRLAIVDEALDQVYVTRLEPEDLHRVQGLIRDPRILQRHLRAVDVIESARHALLKIVEGYHIVSAEDLLAKSGLTAEDADAALVALWNEVREAKSVKPKARLGVKESLTALRRHLAAYRWTESKKMYRAVIGNRLLLPPDAGQVILDATGTLNNVYTGRPDAYEVKRMTPVRDYSSVSLYVAKASGTGKTAMMGQRGESISEKTLDAILAHYGERAAARRVLVVTDLGSEEKVRSVWAKAGFEAFDVAHWNAIDGRNDWRDFDTLVVLNLPWARVSNDISTFMAVKGIELNDAELDAPSDEVKTIRETRIAAELAQAIGRIRLRRMIHENGTCEPCDVFVRTPHWALLADADNIVAGVQRALAGIKVIPWSDASTKLVRANRPSVAVDGVGAQLLAYVGQMEPGTAAPVSEVRERIGAMVHMTWQRVQKSPAVLAGLAELGARIEPAVGRRPAHLAKGNAVVENLSRAERNRRYRVAGQ